VLAAVEVLAAVLEVLAAVLEVLAAGRGTRGTPPFLA
jgi:hypothetical protein